MRTLISLILVVAAVLLALIALVLHAPGFAGDPDVRLVGHVGLSGALLLGSALLYAAWMIEWSAGSRHPQQSDVRIDVWTPVALLTAALGLVSGALGYWPVLPVGALVAAVLLVEQVARSSHPRRRVLARALALTWAAAIAGILLPFREYGAFS